MGPTVISGSLQSIEVKQATDDSDTNDILVLTIKDPSKDPDSPEGDIFRIAAPCVWHSVKKYPSTEYLSIMKPMSEIKK